MKTEAERSYAILHNRFKNTARLSWRSRQTGELYCGICLRGLVEAEVGHTCPNCQSQVQQVFEVFVGGKPRPVPGLKSEAETNWSVAEPLRKVESL